MNLASRSLVRLPAALAAALAFTFGAAAADEDVVVRAMRDELTRSTTQLKLENLAPPYFAAYRVVESTDTRISASFGSIITRDRARPRHRLATIELRVGSPQLDQTNFLPNNIFNSFSPPHELPLDDNYTELRRQLWLATDSAYKQAVEQLAKKKAALENKTRTDRTDDYGSEPPTQTTEEAPRLYVDSPAAEQLVRELSAVFREFPTVIHSTAAIDLSEHFTRYVNSEGTSYTRRETMVMLVVDAVAQAPDGRILESNVLHFARTADALPPKAQLLDETRALGRQLADLQAAPLIEDTYNGPVLFEDAAAAEVFAQVFAPRLVATKRLVVENAQLEPMLTQLENPFMDKLGARVLPDFLNVTDDATRAEIGGAPLFGTGKVDDEGVPTREVKLVEAGRLTTLLTSRVPAHGLLKSTGSRHGGGPAPSNLMVTATEGLSAEALKAELLKLVQQRGKEFGVIVRRVANPAFRTQREQASAPNRESGRIEPAILVYKVLPDGHEELLRNVEVSGLTISAFKDIVAAGKDPFVYHILFNSGGLGHAPSAELVSLAVPSLLFDDVTLKQPSGAIPKRPVAKHPFFDK
jgi:hypothetical protein